MNWKNWHRLSFVVFCCHELFISPHDLSWFVMNSYELSCIFMIFQEVLLIFFFVFCKLSWIMNHDIACHELLRIFMNVDNCHEMSRILWILIICDESWWNVMNSQGWEWTVIYWHSCHELSWIEVIVTNRHESLINIINHHELSLTVMSGQLLSIIVMYYHKLS